MKEGRGLRKPRAAGGPLLLLLLGLLLTTLVVSSHAELPVPAAPLGRVSDFAEALSPDERRSLESKLASYELASTNQIAIAIFKTLDGGSLEDFSIRLAEKWKVGKKGKDNGAILLVFIEDRKMRIEVGYGFEGSLPDVVCSRIIREDIGPEFKKGKYAAGIEAGVARMTAILSSGEPSGAAAPRAAEGPPPFVVIIFLVILAVVVLLMAIFCPGLLMQILLNIFLNALLSGGRGGSYGRSRGGSVRWSGGGGGFGGGGASGSW